LLHDWWQQCLAWLLRLVHAMVQAMVQAMLQRLALLKLITAKRPTK